MYQFSDCHNANSLDLRPIFYLLWNLLFLDDSWQHARFDALLKGTKTIVDKITADT